MAMSPKELRKLVFVFGSNLSGIHGAGAAAHAHQMLGAPWGYGEGYHFDSEKRRGTYALPTKGLNITFMTLDEVQTHTQKFMAFAHDHKGLKFQVTQVGCGLGGFTKEDIAPLFEYAAYEGSNCYFDQSWADLLPKEAKFWGTYA